MGIARVQRSEERRDLKWKQAFVSVSVVVASFCLVVTVPTVEGKRCPGKCIRNVTDCKTKGGKIVGYCTNDMACCDYAYKKVGSCGSQMSKLATAIFQSPDYPDSSHGDLVCQFDFALSVNATGVIVDFSDILIDGRGFTKHSPCESDMFFLKGFPSWTPPPQCGNMSGYAAVIDLKNRFTKDMKKLTVLALMSSDNYRWNIKITQLFQAREKRVIRTTTEAPTDNEANDKEEDNEDDGEGEGDDDNDEAAADEEESSYYYSTGLTEDYENEQEELHRIMQLTSRAKLSRIGATENRYLQVDDETEPNYPVEEPFIVNGDETDISTVPWQASLRTVISSKHANLIVKKLKLKNCTLTEGVHFCGGSVISDSHILSATHCFLIGEKARTWQRMTTIKVVLGDTDLCDENTDGIQEFKIDKIYYHYGYDTRAIINDVAVLKLNKKIRFTDKIQRVKMADEEMDFQNKIGLASGWGLTNLTEKSNETPELLQSADDMYIGNSSYCTKQQLKLYPGGQSQSVTKYPKYSDVFSSLLCTYIRNGSAARVVGQGDSGGPLVVKLPVEKSGKTSKGKSKNKSKSSTEKVEPVLAGVVSYMLPIPHEKKEHDVSNYVDFYQSVPYYRKWIDLAMQ